jgi:phosphatidylserine/phosphatidylglycerophosphate/cardiolipin synthase-like enzyme
MTSPFHSSCLLAILALSIGSGVARAGDRHPYGGRRPDRPDPPADQEIRDAITRAVKGSDPHDKHKGETWNDWRDDTELPADWLLQTPGEVAWGIHPVPGWMSPGEPATCSGSSCNTRLGLKSCDPSQPGACAANQTTCAAAAATVTSPGEAPANVCMSPADQMVEHLYNAVTSANSTVDITTLLPMDGRFLQAFQNALTFLAGTGREVTVRFLYATMPFNRKSADTTLETLVGDAAKVKGSKLTVYVGRIRSGMVTVTGWNHSKTVIIDGDTLLTGGENWFSEDYLGANPVFDLNVKVKGKVAADATGFVNRLWKDLCDHENSPRRDSERYKATDSKAGKVTITDHCLSTLDSGTHAGNGSVHAMAVGRLGEIDYDGGAQSTAAMLGMIGAAKEDIRISQQDIEGPSDASSYGSARWPDDFLAALARQLINGRTVHIVQSSDGAGGSITGYSNGTLADLADKLKSVVKKQGGAPSKDGDVDDLLCKRLYLAQIRFTPGVDRLPGGVGIRNHAKMIAVDDSTFYVGSQNIYPPNRNMEFGIIISDKDQFAYFKSHYWDNLWNNSKQSEISGGDMAGCYYKK